MTAPAPKRRAKSYDPSTRWKKLQAYVPVELAARLRRTAQAEQKAEKDVIIEAMEARLPVSRASQAPDEDGDD